MIQVVGAELDILFKEYCGFNTLDRKKTITDYASFILQDSPDIVDQKISLQQYDIEIQPFKGWSVSQAGQSLSWWSAFTNIKHNRYDKLKQAKQENALNILGALFLIEMMYLKKVTNGTLDVDVFDQSSNLFTLRNWTTKAIPIDQVIDVLSDMFINDGELSKKAFDV